MLTKFNRSILLFALIVLLISLIILGMFLSKSMMEDAYPPVISDCPDYWDVSYNLNDDIICKNVSSINEGRGDIAGGECNDYPKDNFMAAGTDKYDILCEKYKWAKKCNIVWDGVTNNNRACDLAKV